MAAWHLQTPDRWDSESHRYYSEPAPDSELYNLTREVYGVETLFQISLIRHPCKVEGHRLPHADPGHHISQQVHAG